MPSQRPDLTVSIINHSNPALLAICLRSLLDSTTDLRLEVWVIDNATDGSGVAEMRTEFRQVRWLFNPERQGFSANHNQVLNRGSGRYLCILNDDTIVHLHAFDELVRYLDAHPKVGIAGPKLLNPDGSLQDCTFRFPSLHREFTSALLLPRRLAHLKSAAIHPAQFCRKSESVDWVLGACVVVRDTCLREIGVLDDRLSPLANTEEVDWCMRASRAGWQVGYCGAAVITHIGRQSLPSTGPAGRRVYAEMIRTRLAYYQKHHGCVTALLVCLIYIAAAPWNIAVLGVQGLRRRLGRASFWHQAAAHASAAVTGLRQAGRILLGRGYAL